MKTIEINEDKYKYSVSWLELSIKTKQLDVEKDIGNYLCFEIYEGNSSEKFYGILFKNRVLGRDAYSVTRFGKYIVLRHTISEDHLDLNYKPCTISYYWYGNRTIKKNEWLDSNWRKCSEIKLFL